MFDLLLEWVTIGFRWWHVMAGITWIGSSFYFNWLDSLFRETNEKVIKENVRGTLFETHGGNFYYHEQYFPNKMPAKLYVHALPSKTTFITGLTLMGLVYWLGASSYMIDKSVADISPMVAIIISISSIVFAWVFYDILCKSTKDNRVVFAVMAIFTCIMTIVFCHVFGGRAAYISVGVMLGSIMGLNVWLVIAPKSIHMQKQLRNGDGYNHDDGYQAKYRSKHNNYFTIPVVIAMLSNHFALAYNHAWNWLILILLMFAGWSIRHSLNIWYAKAVKLPLLNVAIILSITGAMAISSISAPTLAVVKGVVNEEVVTGIMERHCINCHSEKPTQSGFSVAPQGLKLDTIDELKAAAPKVWQRTIASRDMPLANITGMSDNERAQLKNWLESIK